jgi:long-subunit fatty acid transport protein
LNDYFAKYYLNDVILFLFILNRWMIFVLPSFYSARKNIALVLAFFFSCQFFQAQGWLPMGSRSHALGNASVAIDDIWAYHHNPANLVSIDKISFGLSYENRFLLKELQSQGFVFAMPMKVGVISVGAQTFGYKNFRTNRVGLGYSMKLADFLSCGVQLNYHQIRLNEPYGRKNTLTAELGLKARITENWKVAFSVFNITRTKISDYNEDRLTTLMRLGTQYNFSKKVMVVAELEKNIEYPIRLKTGIEYSPMKKLFLRGGLATNPIELTAGIGYLFKDQFQIDMGTSYHQVLGWSPNFSFTYQLK